MRAGATATSGALPQLGCKEHICVNVADFKSLDSMKLDAVEIRRAFRGNAGYSQYLIRIVPLLFC